MARDLWQTQSQIMEQLHNLFTKTTTNVDHQSMIIIFILGTCYIYIYTEITNLHTNNSNRVYYSINVNFCHCTIPKRINWHCTVLVLYWYCTARLSQMLSRMTTGTVQHACPKCCQG